MVINEKEIEKAYNLFCDYTIKCYGCCQMNYYNFKKCVLMIKENMKEIKNNEIRTNK